LKLGALGDDVDDENEKKRSVPDLLEKGNLGHFSPGATATTTTTTREITLLGVKV
jgi:hypothetical protein